MLLSTLITSFSCSNYLKVRKAEGSVIRLCYGLHGKAGAMFLSPQKVALLDKHLSGPSPTLQCQKQSRWQKKPRAYSFWSLLTRAVVDVRAWTVHNWLCEHHTVCVHSLLNAVGKKTFSFWSQRAKGIAHLHGTRARAQATDIALIS